MKRFLPKTLVARLRLSILLLTAGVVVLVAVVAAFVSQGPVRRQAEHAFLDAASQAARELAQWQDSHRRSAALIAVELAALSADGMPGRVAVQRFLHQSQALLPAGTALTIVNPAGETVYRSQAVAARGDYRWQVSVPLDVADSQWSALHVTIPTAALAETLSDSAAASLIRLSVRYRIIDPAAASTMLVSGSSHPPAVAPGEMVVQNDATNTPIVYTAARVSPTTAAPAVASTAAGPVGDTGGEWQVVAAAPESVVYTASRRLAWALVAGVVLGILAAFFLLPPLLGRLGKGVRALMEEMDALGSGDYKHTVTLEGHDELAGMVRRLNNLADALGEVVEEIERGMEALGNSAIAILTASEEQQAAASQQSTSLQETVSTVEELDLSAKQAAENAQQVVSQVEDASGEILTLSEKAQRINKVGEFIDQISSQIRVLALNASIEASQNEETESGFSVIASEIRRLAEDTRTSTEEIETLVQDMQDSTNSSVMTMEQMVESVKVIGMAMNQQSVATGQISEAMTDMSQSMSQTVESAESSVSQSDEINALVDTLQNAVARLRQAGELLDAQGDAGEETWTQYYDDEDAEPEEAVG